MNEKREYIRADIELVYLEFTDVLTTSSQDGNDPFDPNGWA